MTTSRLIITRDLLGLPDLDLLDGGRGTYGQIVFSRPPLDRTYPTTVPWVDYETPTNIRRTNGSYTIPIRVQGDTPEDMQALLDEVEEAFEQTFFVVEHTYGGITKRYKCIAADINDDTRSRDYDALLASEYTHLVIFTGPHRGRAD